MGTGTYTLSFHQEPNAAHRGHNIRAAAAVKYQDHIDPLLAGQNITIKDQPLPDVYKEVFEPSFQVYRNTSARPDRIRKSYYDTVANDSRLNLCYEAIVQIGEKTEELHRLEADNEKLETENEDLQTENGTLERENTSLKKDRKQLQTEMYDLEYDVSLLKYHNKGGRAG